MPHNTLYAYVDGADLHDIAQTLESEFMQLVSCTRWSCSDPWVVNQKRDDDPMLGPDDLPDWEIGLNMHLPDPGNEPAGWFFDVEQIATFLGRLHCQTNRDFVIGIADNERGISEDLFFITNGNPDLSELRRIIGVDDAGT